MIRVWCPAGEPDAQSLVRHLPYWRMENTYFNVRRTLDVELPFRPLETHHICLYSRYKRRQIPIQVIDNYTVKLVFRIKKTTNEYLGLSSELHPPHLT